MPVLFSFTMPLETWRSRCLVCSGGVCACLVLCRASPETLRLRGGVYVCLVLCRASRETLRSHCLVCSGGVCAYLIMFQNASKDFELTLPGM